MEFEKGATGAVLKRLWKYLRFYKKETVLAPLFKLTETSFELMVPLIVAAIIDRGIAEGDFGYIVRMSLILVAFAVAGLAFAVTAQYFAAKAAVGCSARMRHALFKHISSLSYTEIDSLGASTLITRMTSDINQIQAGVNMSLRLLLRSPFIIFGAMVMSFTVDTKCAMVFMWAIPALAAVIFGIMLVTMPLYRRVQKQLDVITSKTRENINGARVIRAFSMESGETDDFKAQNDALAHIQKFVGKISVLTNPITYIIINGAVIWLIYKGAAEVNIGALTSGKVVALYNYMSQILIELIKLANMTVILSRSIACGKRVWAIMDVKSSMGSGTVTEGDSGAAAVEFDGVSLRYKGSAENAIEGISFTARRGETIGIIGGTGSGKTSLINLIPRFYDASAGSVKVDGVDVRDYDIDALRKKIGVVPQKAALFKGTILSNITWGGDASADAVDAALKAAQAEDIAQSRHNGINAAVEANGANFSGGQRQRLTIARALAREPEIVILDDSASALDLATDAALRDAIEKLPYDPTIFIVSQRVSSVMHADKIIVLEDGAAVGCGTHSELLGACEVYDEIYYSQFPKGVYGE